MNRGIGGGEWDLAEGGRDTELTLGPGMLLAICFGLILLCGLCFGIGYFAGHRNSAESASAGAPQAATTQAAPVGSGSQPKPQAAGQAAYQAQPATTGDVPPDSTTDANSIQSTQSTIEPASGSAPPTQPQMRPALQTQVRPALPSQSNAAQASAPQPGSALQVQPALSQATGLMVQIAAVSHPEDAEVLVTALRKRGYAVAVRRELSDNLMHVQIGPFANRNDANVVRQKLLNDGYNAIVQP